jgi:predicted transcriptional regulator
MRMRDIAQKVGITERAVQRIIADLRDAGYITLHREGRCNSYELHTEKHLKHPIEEARTIDELVRLVLD